MGKLTGLLKQALAPDAPPRVYGSQSDPARCVFFGRAPPPASDPSTAVEVFEHCLYEHALQHDELERKRHEGHAEARAHYCLQLSAQELMIIAEAMIGRPCFYEHLDNSPDLEPLGNVQRQSWGYVAATRFDTEHSSLYMYSCAYDNVEGIVSRYQLLDPDGPKGASIQHMRNIVTNQAWVLENSYCKRGARPGTYLAGVRYLPADRCYVYTPPVTTSWEFFLPHQTADLSALPYQHKFFGAGVRASALGWDRLCLRGPPALLSRCSAGGGARLVLGFGGGGRGGGAGPAGAGPAGRGRYLFRWHLPSRPARFSAARGPGRVQNPESLWGAIPKQALDLLAIKTYSLNRASMENSNVPPSAPPATPAPADKDAAPPEEPETTISALPPAPATPSKAPARPLGRPGDVNHLVAVASDVIAGIPEPQARAQVMTAVQDLVDTMYKEINNLQDLQQLRASRAAEEAVDELARFYGIFLTPDDQQRMRQELTVLQKSSMSEPESEFHRRWASVASSAVSHAAAASGVELKPGGWQTNKRVLASQPPASVTLRAPGSELQEKLVKASQRASNVLAPASAPAQQLLHKRAHEESPAAKNEHTNPMRKYLFVEGGLQLRLPDSGSKRQRTY